MRQYAQPDQLDQYIAFHFQGATPHERAWLRSLQHYFVHPAFPDLVRKAAGDVLVSGIPRESPAFLQGVAHKLFGQPANAAPTPAPPPMEPPPMPAPPPHDIKEHDDEPQPHHYAAPPSRDFAHVAVEPDSMPGRITLSPQERDHARASGVYDEIYAQQKSKMLKAKKAGIIKD